MTSPRNLQPQRAALTPSFVEFDMSAEGYGYGELSYIWKMIYSEPLMIYNIGYKLWPPLVLVAQAEMCLSSRYPSVQQRRAVSSHGGPELPSSLLYLL